MTPSQRYVLFRGEVFRWEEKSPYSPSGRSILGGFEYAIETGRIRCHECGEWFRSIAVHAPRKHNLSLALYRDRHQVGCRGLTSPETKRARPRPGGDIAAWWRSLTVEQKQAHEQARLAGVRARSERPGRLRWKPGHAERRNLKGLCPAQVLAAIRTKAAILGHCPGNRDVPSTVCDQATAHFGSWTEACRQAEMTPKRQGWQSRAVTTEEALESLRDFYVLNGTPPTTQDLRTSARLYNFRVYKRLFGGFSEALRAAGLGFICAHRPGTRKSAGCAPAAVHA